MAFPNQKTPNILYLQLLRGYTIINAHERASSMCYLLSQQQIQKIYSLWMLTYTKNYAPVSAPLFSLLEQYRLAPTHTFASRACTQ